jgi:alpha-glucosidase
MHWLHTVHHDGSEKYLSTLCPAIGETVRVRLRIGEDAPLQRVILRTFPDGEQAFTPMTAAAHEPPVRWWEADLTIHQPLEHYRFLLQADDSVWWYTAAGPVIAEPLDYTDFRIVAGYDSPAWLQETVFYQIYPDRFANGDPANDPRPDEYTYRGWHSQTFPWGTPVPDKLITPLIFYGGDLPGITQHLDHLERLGVNAIYLNPVFTAYSSHRYDPIDYTHVDPHLGGDEALIALRRALDERGMRYILDIMPNHCGFKHPWFLAAQADPNAPEAAFFTFRRHPDDYHSWLGHMSLAKLNYQSAELRRRMYDGTDSIFRRWLRAPFAADGWRVDVANMLGRQGDIQLNAEIARGMRCAVKETRADAYLIGENFYDASPQLQGDQWDAVMNYTGLATPLWHCLGGYHQGAIHFTGAVTSPVPYPTAALDESWRLRRAAIPWVIAQQQYNLLGSHDTHRMRSVVGGSDALHRLAVTVQLTYPGVPALYYGDEIGMVDAPHLRSIACMTWDESQWDQSLFAFYQDLIALRRRSHVLQRGGFQMLAVEADTFAYQRDSTDGRILVIAHRGSSPRPAGGLPVAHGGIADGTRFVEHFSGQQAVVTNGALNVPEHAQGASLWEEIGT